MGMGEPLANYDSVIQAIGIITSNNGLQFSNRRVTLSTAGLVPRIEDLGQDITVNLAVSLNAADNKTRNQLMPINRTYPIEELLSACRRFPLPSRRMITFEYVLIAGVNDRPDDAKRLARILKPVRAKINLIPFNAYPGSPFKKCFWIVTTLRLFAGARVEISMQPADNSAQGGLLRRSPRKGEGGLEHKELLVPFAPDGPCPSLLPLLFHDQAALCYRKPKTMRWPFVFGPIW